MTIEPLEQTEVDQHLVNFQLAVKAEYLKMLVSPVFPESLKGRGHTALLNMAIRKVARSIWLPPNARQPEKEYGLR